MLHQDTLPDYIRAILPTNSHIPNQYFAQLLGIAGVNPMVMCVSSVRNQMFCNQLGQALVVVGATEARFQSGMEDEYGKYTFASKMPCDGRVIGVYQRYKQTVGVASFKTTPSVTFIYESDDTREIGLMEIPFYGSYHQHFGFRFKQESGMSLLYKDSDIPKGTVFTDSPNKTDTGAYKIGIEANVAFCSHPACAEDGIVISESFAKRAKFYTYERRRITFNPDDELPLLLYPGDNIFPEIGDYTLPNGLLMAFRKYSPEMLLCNLDAASLRKVDYQFDRRVYSGGRAGRVVDIKICFGGGKPYDTTNPLIAQCMRYEAASRQYHKEIDNEYRRLYSQSRGQVQINEDFGRTIIEGFAVNGFRDNNDRGGSTQTVIPAKKYKNAPIRGWQIEFVVEYDNVPERGNKFAGFSGDKGVVVAVMPDELMPVDKAGNVCEVLMDELSTMNRMNPSRLWIPFFNTFSRDLGIKLRGIVLGEAIGMGMGRYFGRNVSQHEFLSKDLALRNEAVRLLLKYYSIVSPLQHAAVMRLDNVGIMEHLRYVLINGITIRRPTHTDAEIVDSAGMLVDNPDEFPQTYGPINFKTNGVDVWTKEPIRISTMNMMLLEKTGDDFSAIASAKTNRFGVIGKQSPSEKHSSPVRLSSVRVLGEAEAKLFIAFVDGKVLVELHDRSNNAITAKMTVRSVLSSKYPTNIWSCVDRNLVKLGCARPLQHFNHASQTKGWTLEYLAQP